jgi:hypothetical protein
LLLCGLFEYTAIGSSFYTLRLLITRSTISGLSSIAGA